MKQILLASLVLLMIVMGPGCQLTGDSPTSPAPPPDDPTETVIDLDSPTGGYTFSDEEPAFGESDMYYPMMNERAVEDGTENETDVQNMIRHRRAKMYRFRAIWGRLANAYRDSTASDCCPVDWSGTLHMNGGVIIIERLIAFDAKDYVTRIDRSTISWVSHTCPHVDGIQVRLIVAPGPKDSTNIACVPTLTIETGPYSRTFTIDELAVLNFMQPVDRCGNGISINSHIIPPYCPHGYLAGAWRSVEPDTIVVPPDSTDIDRPDTTETRKIILGKYRGIWISGRGCISGYLRGVYGINSGGERVFVGKYIDMNGRFMGIIRGEYGSHPDMASIAANRHGWFAGHWLGKDRAVQGRLKGHWIAAEPGWGYFHGVWGMLCSTNL